MNIMDVEMITTDDLAKELLRRCDHGALILMRCGEAGKSDNVYIRRWHGNVHAAMGLCDDLRDFVLQEHRKLEKPWDGQGT